MLNQESNFSDTELQDYSESPRVQERISGQKSAIGEVDTKDARDMLRLWLLDIGSGTDQLVGEVSTDEELFNWAKNKDKDWYMWSIRGSQGVPSKEIGEIQGWVQFYPEDEVRLGELVDKGLVQEPDQYTRIFETSYIRLQSAEKGQVASALRQALLLLHHKVNSSLQSDAYIRTKYLITSYVNPKEDPDSVLVLQNAGFERVGEIKYDENSTGKDDVYILNWQKLYQKVDENLFDS